MKISDSNCCNVCHNHCNGLNRIQYKSKPKLFRAWPTYIHYNGTVTVITDLLEINSAMYKIQLLQRLPWPLNGINQFMYKGYPKIFRAHHFHNRCNETLFRYNRLNVKKIKKKSLQFVHNRCNGCHICCNS
jgi:hypothetical protein